MIEITRTETETTFERTCRRDPQSGFGVMQTTNGGNLPLKQLDVQSRVSGLSNRTVIRQVFQNNHDEPVEATYIFPLPGRDAVTGFVMQVGDRRIDGVLKERAAARQEYDQAIQKGHRAAIAEENRSETFSMRAGNIPAGESISIELTLIGMLPVAGGEALFRFPLVVAPRYISGAALSGAPSGAGTSVDTNQVPDASHISPPVLLPGFPNPVRLNLEVEFDGQRYDAAWLKSLRSTLHTVVVNEPETGDPVRLRLSPGERLNRDFILRFPVGSQDRECSLESVPATSERKGVFAMTLVPPSKANLVSPPRDIVFLLDRSGSMGGWKMVAARRAIGRMIDTMRDQDRFSVIAFDTSVEFSPPDSLESGGRMLNGTNRNRWNTLQWVTGIDQRGGTEIERAVISGLDMLKSESKTDREQIVVLITDGQIGAEDATLKAISNYSPARFFTLGIDRAVNHGFLSRVAQMTGGTCETVETENQLDHVMDRFHCEIGKPLVTGISIKAADDSNLEQLTPQNALNLFADRPLTIHGRTDSTAPDQLEISGQLTDGSMWRQTLTARTGDQETLMALWGRQRVRDLEDQYAINHQPAIEKQIVEVSLESSVLSRFTAYVAVDRSEVVNEGGEQHQITQTVEMPEGMNKMFAGRAMAPGKRSRGKMRKISGRGRSAIGKMFGLGQSESKSSSTSSPNAPGPTHSSLDSNDLGGAASNGSFGDDDMLHALGEFDDGAAPASLDDASKQPPRPRVGRIVPVQKKNACQDQDIEEGHIDCFETIDDQPGNLDAESVDSFNAGFTDVAIDFTTNYGNASEWFEDAMARRANAIKWNLTGKAHIEGGLFVVDSSEAHSVHQLTSMLTPKQLCDQIGNLAGKAIDVSKCDLFARVTLKSRNGDSSWIICSSAQQPGVVWLVCISSPQLVAIERVQNAGSIAELVQACPPLQSLMGSSGMVIANVPNGSKKPFWK